MEPAIEVKKARKFASKISWKRKQCIEMMAQIKAYLSDTYQINLPKYKNNIFHEIEKGNISSIFPENDKFTSDELYKHTTEIINFYYNLFNSGQTIYAKFESQKNYEVELVPAAIKYNRHRFDPVWLYRKSQLIRKKYMDFFKNNPEYRNEYIPCHLVLTVPHPNGKWKGKEFYGKELLKDFNLLRKRDFWKKYVVAGELHVEVAASNFDESGLHIHIHALVFQKSDISVHEMKKLILDEWAKMSGKERPRFDHYEEIYIYKRKENGQYETNLIAKELTPNSIKLIETRVKEHYQKDWDEQKFMSAILETIKYHFKMDSVLKDGIYDVELIINILNNSKNMKFYNRFGEFYNKKELGFERYDTEEKESSEFIDEETGEVLTVTKHIEDDKIIYKDEITGNIVHYEKINENENDESDNLRGSSDLFESKLINPFTYELAKKNEFIYVIGMPELMKYGPKPNFILHEYSFHEIYDENELKSLIKDLNNNILFFGAKISGNNADNCKIDRNQLNLYEYLTVP